MVGFARKMGVVAFSAATLAAVSTAALLAVVGGLVVLVMFAFWLTAYCPVDRQPVGVKVFSMLLHWLGKSPGR